MKHARRMMMMALLGIASAGVWAEEPVPFNGMVIDATGKPLRGVRVYTFDRNYYSTSDRKGRFGLTNVAADDTLHLRYNRTDYVIPVEGRKSIRIILGDQREYRAESDVELENLGYGYIDRRESVSASNGISGEVLQRTGRINLLEALQGLVPGVTVLSENGETKVIIRGISTINGSSDPLYIVDGVEVGSLEYLNIYDVECVEVMKEAYIYGSRGANGAILVTTKKAKP